MASIKLKGDTSGEVTISAPAVAGTNTLTLPAETGTLATTTEVNNVYNSLGVRNLIINGDMRIAQRGTSVASITGTGYYTVDRFRFNVNSLGTWTQSQSTDVPTGQGFATSLKLDCTTANAVPSAGDLMVLQHLIEGQNLQHLKKGTANALPLTVSFWVKSTKTGTFIFELKDVDNLRTISKAYTINSADTWEKKTITVDGDTTGAFDNDNGGSLIVNFWLGAGTNFTSGTLQTTWGAEVSANRTVGQVNIADSTSNDWYITGVQLEVGTEATPFEHRPYDMEFQRCQRYYQKHIQVNIAANHDTGYSVNMSSLGLPVTMRTAPTVTTGTVVAAGHGNGTFDAIMPNLSSILFQVTSGNTMYRNYGVRWVFDYFANSEL